MENESDKYQIECVKCKKPIIFASSSWGKDEPCPSCNEINKLIPVFTEVSPEEAKQERQQHQKHPHIPDHAKGVAMRPSLTEASFRRYEVYLALACYGSYKVYPRQERLSRTGKGVTPHSFANNFRDAKKAFALFSYHSTMIDKKKFNPETIIATEQPDGVSVDVNNNETSKMLTKEEIDRFKDGHDLYGEVWELG